jgi:hypothetical protein
MGLALQVVTGRATNPGATVTTLTANTGDTFTVRSFPEGSPTYLEGMWTQQATAGIFQAHSPRMHDDVRGIRFVAPAALPRNFMGDRGEQLLFPNDPLNVQITGGGAEVDAGAILVYYNNLPGIDARLAMWDQVKSRIANLLTVVVTTSDPTTSGDWSAGNVFTTDSDLLKSDTDYAVLGYEVNVACLAVALAGSDTGNLKVGGPGPIEPLETRDWFQRLSIAHGTPHIPVFNSNNRGSILSHVARVGTGSSVAISWHLAQLR